MASHYPSALTGFVLFNLAKSTYERISASVKARDSHRECLVPIVFAAFAVEGFINEVGSLAHMRSVDSPRLYTSQALREFGAWWVSGESRGSASRWKRWLWRILGWPSGFPPTRKKYQVALRAFGGKFDKKNFELLMELRNSIGHLKPRDLWMIDASGKIVTDQTGRFQRVRPRILQKLRPLGTLWDVPEDEAASWIDLVSTPAMARWAVDTAFRLIYGIIDVAPEPFRSIDMRAYRELIQPLPPSPTTGTGAGST